MFKKILGGLTATFLMAQAAAASDIELAARLAAASPENGQKIFRKCKSCHTVKQSGKNRTGPNLWAIVGRDVASADGFSKFSKALKSYSGVWTPERLDAFLERPKAEVEGTRMTFTGLKKANERADLIAYLNQNSPMPQVFGEAGSVEPTVEVGEAPDIGVLFLTQGAVETYDYCTGCHSERIVSQQGQTRDGWAELLEWMVDEQGMSPIEEPDLTLVLDYLATNYGLDRPNFPRK